MEITIDSKHLKSETEIQAEQKKELKFIGSTRKMPGLTTFEFNTRTKELKPAQFDEVKIEVLGAREHQCVVRHKLAANDWCVYVQALNPKNAIKKLAKLGI